MSQFREYPDNGKVVMYGRDHTIGFFVDVFTKEAWDDGDMPFIEESSLFTGIGLKQAIEIGEAHGAIAIRRNLTSDPEPEELKRPDGLQKMIDDLLSNALAFEDNE